MLASSFLKRPFGTREAAFGGIAAGGVVLGLSSWGGMTLATAFPNAPLAFTSINMGLVALFANAVVFVAISAAQRLLRARIDTAVGSA
jgi:SSS family solute:Na+ symporter